MADAVNRILPPSVALARASWKGRERQKRREEEARAGTPPVHEPDAKDAPAGAEAKLAQVSKDKGKHLDVSV